MAPAVPVSTDGCRLDAVNLSFTENERVDLNNVRILIDLPVIEDHRYGITHD